MSAPYSIEILPNGIRKRFEYATLEIYTANLAECLSKEDLNALIIDLSSLPSDALTTTENTLLTQLKTKRASDETVKTKL